jgi:23S rRNA (pseudouridine1915-N3)-methyltransferase
MRIWIAAIGARPRDAFDELARMYLARIAPLLPGGSKSAPKTVEAPLFRREDAFWQVLERERTRTPPLVVLLDERGKQMNSEAFAAWLGRTFDAGRQFIVFAVGPADGWSKRPPEAVTLSLGPMTLAHELAWVVVCEQIYRALTILRGHPYHRGSGEAGS